MCVCVGMCVGYVHSQLVCADLPKHNTVERRE